MDNAAKCKSWFFMTTSALGLFVGLAGFFVFMFTYANYQAGSLACFSGLLAALCLHLQILNHFDLMEDWYNPVIMRRVTIFAITILLGALALMGWYLSNIISKHQGFYPIETSNPARAVMSFLTLKWAISLMAFSIGYRRKMIHRAFAYHTLSEEPENASPVPT